MAEKFTPEQIAELRANYMAGVKVVRFADGRMIVYHTMDEMLKAINIAEATVAGDLRDPVSYGKFTRG